MGENVLDNILMDLDLNQEPPDPPPDSVLGFRSILNTLESAHSRIEERIRHLESVTARAWERHRLRRTQNFSDTFDGQIGNSAVVGVSSGGGRGHKRDNSHLVAKALAMDSNAKKGHKDGATFFDCNVCLTTAREPVLTCCGHLYCWSCFFQLPYVDSMVKECPVCMGDVSDGKIIPIYCNGISNCGTKPESGPKIPPRPKAHRVESVRQQHLARGLSHIPVAEALRRIRASIGMLEPLNPLEQIGINVDVATTPSQPQELPNGGDSRRVRSREFSRVLSESAASLSSELDNAQRIFEDLAASISDRLSQRDGAQDSSTAGDSFVRENNGARLEHQILETPTEISSSASIPPSSRGNEDSDAVVQLVNLIPTTSGERDQPFTRSSSSSRIRFSLFRFSDVNNDGSDRETRRRLN
ncbi:hypothetical protein DM860_001226 [Cuscuta australis]|uniref:E3 ubiquitin-protein ligase RMA n=2 Tax=Cuscuta sect. Cleistogrammica TaxID=1824901 RepID=A0A328DUA5_9ASTE|nr:hypothetical protein DM860_001226 [Cuscuta australis]